ncbi:MAG: aminotransferase class I/II-fold pyridoxal phosphate-dependent enzyme [Anaerolineales bacterium]
MPFKTGPSTRCVHAGAAVDPLSRSILPPIVENAAFAFPDLESWRQVATHERAGDTYSRNSNPTERRFEEKVAALEGAEAGVSFSTGMAAIHTTLMALLNPGHRTVSIRDSYGATYLHFTQILPRFGIDCAVCDTLDESSILAEIEAGCDLLYMESPTNPLLRVVDLAKLAAAAHEAGALVVVDNTFATPINQHPIELGADLVVHSATKYLGGHNDVMAGVAVGSKELIERIYHYRELTGPGMDPRRAHALLRSIKTLALRVERQNANAMAMAEYLEGHPKVGRVYYPGLESDPGHEIAESQMSGFGGVLSFEVDGGLEAIGRFLPKLKYAYLAPNLGQVDTIVGPPALTSHVELTEAERAASGVPEGLVRYAVGIEDIKDLREDMESALASL